MTPQEAYEHETFQLNTPQLAMHGFCNIFAEIAAKTLDTDALLILNGDDNSLIHALVNKPNTNRYFDADDNQVEILETALLPDDRDAIDLAYHLFDIDSDEATPYTITISATNLAKINNDPHNDFSANTLDLLQSDIDREWFKHWCKMRTTELATK